MADIDYATVFDFNEATTSYAKHLFVCFRENPHYICQKMIECGHEPDFQCVWNSVFPQNNITTMHKPSDIITLMSEKRKERNLDVLDVVVLVSAVFVITECHYKTIQMWI